MKTLQKILSMVFFLLILSISYANEAVYSLQVDPRKISWITDSSTSS